jgi:FKBP-type peptidyl-prolyl cis-trans isomerase
VGKRIDSGVRILSEIRGTGAQATMGDTVEFEIRIALSHGDVVHERRAERTRIGERRLVAGIEKALVGMREGGYRKVRVSPHLAYRDVGVAGVVPPDAVLICEVWLLGVVS